MKYSCARLPHGKSAPLPALPGVFLLLVLGLTGWVAACTPAAADAPTAPSQRYTLYLSSWAEENPDDQLVPLDPKTLDDQTDSKTVAPQMFSADGSTGVDVAHPWIIVYDVRRGAERNRFHAPAKSFVTDISADGARLLLQPDPFSSSRYPPTVEWYVVGTTNGERLTHIEDGENACFRQSALLDPAGERIYCVVDPALTKAETQVPMQIVAYDIDNGARAEEIELPQVLIGGLGVELDGQMVEHFLEPAVALSPDGQQLAVVHADADGITLLNARSLTVEKSFDLRRSTSLWDLLGLAPASAHAKGDMQGTIRQAVFSTDGQYLYVFTQELWLRPQDAPAERGLWLVDLAQGTIATEALPDYRIQWLRPAPDGSLYAFGTTDQRMAPYEIRATSPSMLWRLDGRTLEILAQRAFTGYRHGYLVVRTAATLSPHATASNEQDCPLTQTPETPFVPPQPWPSQPPGEDQFWFGDSGLWTALPAGGSWRQLAMGEKFWWWSEEFDVAEDDAPDLTVTARRLDGDAHAFQTSEATNGYHESFNWAMLVGVQLASPGCWEFTGQYKGHELSFVLWVPPQSAGE